MKLLDTLSLMLEDVHTSSIDISNIRAVNEEAIAAKANVERIQRRLRELVEHQLIDLAIRTRREYPFLNIAITENNCKIGRRSSIVEFSIKNGVWVVRSNDQDLRSLFTVDNVVSVRPNKMVVESLDGSLTLNGRSTSLTRLYHIHTLLEEKYSYSSTQFNIPEKESRLIKKLADDIDQADLGEDGLEDNYHVTVKYGIHTDSASEIRKIVSDFGPVSMTIGKTSLFENDQDVLKFDVTSTDLRKLNSKIARSTKCTDTHPEYKPHITIAYLKSGHGKKYRNDDTLSGVELTLNTMVFSSKNGKKTEISLTH